MFTDTNANLKDFYFTVDTINKSSLCVADVVQGDTNVRMNVTVTKRGKTVDLTGYSVTLFSKKPDGKMCFQNDGVTVTDPKHGKILIELATTPLESVGTVVSNLDFRTESDYFTSSPFFYHVGEKIGNTGAVESHIDVPMYWKVSDYIDISVAQIDKYKTLFEGFVEAGVSLEGLNNIKLYIDNNIAELKDRNETATNLIPQVNTVIDNGENKRLEVVQATNTAEEKRKALQGTIDNAVTNNNKLDSSINAGTTLKSGLDSDITAGTTLKNELKTATDTANTTKTNLDTSIKNGTAKVTEVKGVISNAETKRQELQTVIDNVGSADIVTSGQMAEALNTKLDVAGGKIDGELEIKTSIKGSNLATGDKQVLSWWNKMIYLGNATTDLNMYCVDSPNIINTKGSFKAYHTGYKPTPADIGASASDHNHDTAYLKADGTAVNSSKVNNIAFKNTAGTTPATHLWGKTSEGSGSGYYFPASEVTVGKATNSDVSALTKGLNIPYAPRISSTYGLETCGFFAFGSGCAGAPTDYGVLLNIIWGDDNIAQAVWGVTGGSMYIRYKNKTWSAWRTW